MATEFGFTEATADIARFECLADVDLFVPALRLNVDLGEEAFAQAISKCAVCVVKKYDSLRWPYERVVHVQQPILVTRQQIRLAMQLRVDVLAALMGRATGTRGHTRSSEGAQPWKCSHRCSPSRNTTARGRTRCASCEPNGNTYCSDPHMAHYRWDKLDRRLSHRQCEQRLGSRLTSMLKHLCGGMKCLLQFKRTQPFGPRVLPALAPLDGSPPEPAPCAKRRCKQQMYRAQRKYYDNMAMGRYGSRLCADEGAGRSPYRHCGENMCGARCG